jgi:phosphatidylserine/phosphatidylglycerophosphate/cardiolipin synthase-like enzyme
MFGRKRVLLVLITALIAAPSAGFGAVTVETAYAPSNDLALTLEAIEGAQRSIELNIYELTSPEITDALISRIQAGVTVVILNEGQPVGGLSTVAKGVQSEIVKAMGPFSRTDHFYEMTSKAGGTRRFHYDHAKYAVIDSANVLIGSENYSPTGNPDPGSVGNRGWEVYVHDATLAAQYERVFANDATTRAGDVLELTNQSTDVIPGAGAVPVARFPEFTAAQLGVIALQASAVTPFTSPDTSLSGLVATIRSATRTLDIEQMSFNSAWTPTGTTSPLLTEVIAAAKRGVRVRVLLNDETVFNPGGAPSAHPINPVTVATLNRLAAAGTPIEARIANLRAMGVDYIHNKGAIVDSVRTLISSINWDANAVLKNREAAVVVDGPDIGAYYEKIFESDWTASGGAPAQRLDLVANVAGAARLPALPAATVLASCPSQVEVDLEIGTLRASDLDDRDYLSLSGKTIKGTFVRDPGETQCLLVLQSSGPVSGRQFLEFSASRDGGLTAQLDGFTPRTSKVYTVRAAIPSGSRISGSFAGALYGGATEREKLGPAVLNLIVPR